MRAGSKANPHSPSAALHRISFMLVCREPFSVSTRGRPDCRPNCRRRRDRARIVPRTSWGKPKNSGSNSSAISTRQRVGSICNARHMNSRQIPRPPYCDWLKWAPGRRLRIRGRPGADRPESWAEASSRSPFSARSGASSRRRAALRSVAARSRSLRTLTKGAGGRSESAVYDTPPREPGESRRARRRAPGRGRRGAPWSQCGPSEAGGIATAAKPYAGLKGRPAAPAGTSRQSARNAGSGQPPADVMRFAGSRNHDTDRPHRRRRAGRKERPATAGPQRREMPMTAEPTTPPPGTTPQPGRTSARECRPNAPRVIRPQNRRWKWRDPPSHAGTGPAPAEHPAGGGSKPGTTERPTGRHADLPPSRHIQVIRGPFPTVEPPSSVNPATPHPLTGSGANQHRQARSHRIALASGRADAGSCPVRAATAGAH